MEEESWASCGNRDYLTPWDLSSLSTKSSPMLSMMLGVEGEDGPSWNSWSPSLMCMNIIFNVSSPLLPQFPSTYSCTKSWSQSLLHIIVASFNSSLSHCCLIFTNFSFNFQNIKHCSIAKCTNFPFQWVLIRPKLIPNKRVVSVSSQRRNLSWRISERATSKVFAISPCTGLQIHWSWMRWNGNFMELLNINFFFLVRLFPCAKFDENSRACSQTLEMLTNLISSLITNSWERFVMPAKQSSAHTTPGWWLGVETIANKPKTSPKILNLRHN